MLDAENRVELEAQNFAGSLIQTRRLICIQDRRRLREAFSDGDDHGQHFGGNNRSR